MPREYNHYEYKLIERRIAGEMARRVGVALNDDQRNLLIEADKEMRQSQERLQRLTREIVDEVMGGTRNRFAA